MSSISKEAERAAESVLESAWFGEKDSPILPVDPAQIARKLGIGVYETQLEPDVFAVLVKELGRDPVIALNEADSPNRKRFSCAHEIGHFIRRSDEPNELERYAYLDKRNALSSAGVDQDEMYANSFAASLLMPRTWVEQFRRKGLQRWEMTMRFDVSQEALVYRLQNLGLL